jgi:hypothetical protein
VLRDPPGRSDVDVIRRRYPDRPDEGEGTMSEFSIGQTVQITGTTMTGDVGTIVHIDQKKDRYLVRIDAQTQNWFSAADLQSYPES